MDIKGGDGSTWCGGGGIKVVRWERGQVRKWELGGAG